MNRLSREACKECTFRDAAGVQVLECRHGLVNDLRNSLYSIRASDQFKPFFFEP